MLETTEILISIFFGIGLAANLDSIVTWLLVIITDGGTASAIKGVLQLQEPIQLLI